MAMNKWQLKYYLSNKEKVIKRSREWIEKHPEWTKEYYKKYESSPKRTKWRSEYRKRNRDKINLSKRKMYQDNKESRRKNLESQKRHYDKSRFNGFRDICLERDNYTCQKCSGKNNLHVHHLRYGDDLELKDLITLCTSCHMKEHTNLRGGSFKWELQSMMS